MKVREGTLAVGVVALGLALHIVLRQHMISLVPLLILLPICFTWAFPSPGYWLIAGVVLAELFTVLPPGVATLIILLPLLIHRLRPHDEIDLSFTFGLLLLLTVASQSILLLSPLLVQIFRPRITLAMLQTVPWHLWLSMVVASTLASWALCLGLQAVMPHTRSHIVTFEKHLPRRRR